MSDQRRRKTLIYLTGFMGSGKSTIGPILANTLGYGFSDVDRIIEARAGKSVNRIFREDGEKAFRAVERQVIAELSALDHHVISLGGGTVVDETNFATVRNTGILIYLYSTPEHLLARLQHKSDRPVLASSEGERLSADQLREKVMNLFAAREPLYSQANLIIHTDEQRVGITVDEIVRRLHAMKR
ncbi:MAG: shikimate kinase [Ignavibacteriae bacterium]|nr:shikimate kinase [Ignavibacteriota bacterium]